MIGVSKKGRGFMTTWLFWKFALPVVVPPALAFFVVYSQREGFPGFGALLEVGGLYWFAVTMSASCLYDLFGLAPPHRELFIAGHIFLMLFSAAGYAIVILRKVRKVRRGDPMLIPQGRDWGIPALFASTAAFLGVLTYFV